MHWSKTMHFKRKQTRMDIRFEDLKIGDRVCHDYINGLFFVVGLDNGFVDIFSIELDRLITGCTISILRFVVRNQVPLTSQELCKLQSKVLFCEQFVNEEPRPIKNKTNGKYNKSN